MAKVTAGNAAVSLTVSGGTAITADCARATATFNNTPIDTTAIGSAYKQYAYGIREATAQIEFYWDHAVHGALGTALGAGTKLSTATVTWESGHSISGAAMIEAIEVSLAPNSVAMATVSVRWEGGAITYA
jgi:hypothetical protein